MSSLGGSELTLMTQGTHKHPYINKLPPTHIKPPAPLPGMTHILDIQAICWSHQEPISQVVHELLIENLQHFFLL